MGVELEVGGWFASAIISKVIDKARSYLQDNYELHTSTGDMLSKLDAALPQIQAVIDFAESRQIKNEALTTWMRQLKYATYEAEDVLDEFDYKYLHCKLKGKSMVSDFLPSVKALKNIFLPNDELKKLKKIVAKLNTISDCIGNFIQVLKETNNQQIVRRESTSLLTEDKVFGRDSEKYVILEILLSPGYHKPNFDDKRGVGRRIKSNLCVLPIIGIGGVGKTTLSQLIYNDRNVEEHFCVKIWLSVSDNFDMKKLMKRILEHFTCVGPNDDMSLDAIQVKLKENINMRFLLVLDDVWDDMIPQWKALWFSLIFGPPGSVVLITTRCPRVAIVTATVGPITLDVLGEDDFWHFFQHCAFDNEELEEERMQKLQSIGRNICSKLHGLPLAGKALGRLLHSRLEEDHWTNILGSEWWDLPNEANIMPSLGLSYQHLDANLKQCFAYCSIFPKNYIFAKDTLVQMWIAQGFIHPDERGRKRMEDIGIQWFNELIDRAFFLPTWDNRFLMHDLMRELAIYVSLDECFVLRDESGGIPQTIRHLSIRTDNLDLFPDMDKFRNLRTVLFFGDYDPEEFFKFLKRMFKQLNKLRVVDLSYCCMNTESLPGAIGGLLHLRYLDLSFTNIEWLPKSFRRLYHLQSLNLNGCCIKKLPRGINRLINLRHIYASGYILSLIAGIGKLTCLQELEEFRVRKIKGHKIGELKELRELRGGILIQDLDNLESKKNALEAKLMDKEHLNSLHLSWNMIPISHNFGELKEILEGLQPHPNLKELKLSYYRGTESPSWMVEGHCLANLESIHLHSCDGWICLPPVGQLSSLRIFEINGMHSVSWIGSQFYGDNVVVFPSLEELVITDMDCEEWSEVKEGRRLFPRLRKLHIIRCRTLKKFPLLCLTSSLVELKLYNCGDLGSALPRCLQYLKSLSIMEICYYPHEVSLDLHNLSALHQLRLTVCLELRLIGGLDSLISLKRLEIKECPKLTVSLQLEGLYEEVLPALMYLYIDSNFLISSGRVLTGRLPSLKVLHIEGGHQFPKDGESGDSLVTFSYEQEAWFQHCAFLQELHFSCCTGLQCLPVHLITFSNLQKLVIVECSDIKSMPENGLPGSLKELHIDGCKALTARCLKEDWPIISHIQHICFDGKIILVL